MDFLVSYALMTLDECHKSICMLTWHLYRRIIHFINLFIIEVYRFIFISLIFNNYVMENYARFYDFLEHFRIEKSCRSRTIVNHACSTPNACTTSFLYTSWVFANIYIYIYIFFFSLLVELELSSQMLSTLDIFHQQGNFPCCSYYHWLSN